MAKILTLEDVGIPNVSEEHYLALPLQERISMMLKIRDQGRTLESQIEEPHAQSVAAQLFVYGYNLDDKSNTSEEDLFKPEFTYRRLVGLVEGLINERESWTNVKNLPEGFFGPRVSNPYWLNNFPYHFFEALPEYLKGEFSPPNSGFRSLKFYQELCKAADGQDLSPIRNSLKTDFERDKLAYPYFITLRKEGFSDIELDG